MKDPSLKVSKLDAAARQLATAIRLYFHSGDPISIHSLGAAALSVLENLNEKAGYKPSTRQEVLETAKKLGLYDVTHKAFIGPQNFFKHADKDPDAVLEFKPRATEFVLYEACMLYRRLTSEQPPTFQVFQAWFLIQYPEIIEREMPQVDVERIKKELGEMNRLQFYRELLVLYEGFLTS